MEDLDSALAEKEEMIRLQAEKENKLDQLIKDKINALTQIKDLVSQHSVLEKDLHGVCEQEHALDARLSAVKKDIGDISLKLESAQNSEESLLIHKQKTGLIKQTAEVEEELDVVTKKKAEILDKLKELTKKRSELEISLDTIDEEQLSLKKEISDIKNQTNEFLHTLSKDIGGMDRNEDETSNLPDSDGEPAPENETSDASYSDGGPASDSFEENLSESGPAESSSQESADGPVTQQDGPSSETESMNDKQDPVFAGDSNAGDESSEDNVIAGDESPADDDIDIGLLRKVLNVMDDLLEKLPDDVISDFSSSDEFKAYKDIYSTIMDYSGKPEQKAFINENISAVLTNIDNLLENLEGDVINEFLESEDFKLYSKVLETYVRGD